MGLTCEKQACSVESQRRPDLAVHRLLPHGVHDAVLALQVVLQAGGLARCGDGLLQALDLPPLGGHALVDLLPDTWHAEKDGWPGLLDGLKEGAFQSHLVSEKDGASVHKASPHVDGVGCDVAEGQVGDEHLLAPLEIQELRGRTHRPVNVVVREHDALGVSGRPCKV